MSSTINRRHLGFILLSSLVLLSLIGIPAVSGNARKWFARSASHSSTVTVLATSEASLSAERSDRIEAELITITPDGFEPQEITRPKGQVLLVVTNRSGLPELSLRLDRNGNRVRELTVSNEILDWSEIVDLPAGDYVLTEANHADWFCHVTITD